MRLVPNTDTVPASVNKYLLPHERQVITVHQHPAILIRPIFEVLIGLAIAGWLSNSVANGNNIAILVIWWVIEAPASAAHVVHNIGTFLSSAASGITQFFASI